MKLKPCPFCGGVDLTPAGAGEELVLWEVKLGPHAEPDKEAIR